MAFPPSAAAVSRVESALADAAAAAAAAAAANVVVPHAAPPSFITGVLEPGFPRSSDIDDIDQLVEPLGEVVLHVAEGDCCGAKAFACATLCCIYVVLWRRRIAAVRKQFPVVSPTRLFPNVATGLNYMNFAHLRLTILGFSLHLITY
jgi:hypothetical protein